MTDTEEEQQEQELAEDRNRDLLDVELIREEQWPPGETKYGGEEQVKAIGDQELLVNDVDDIEETSVSHGTADDLLLADAFGGGDVHRSGAVNFGGGNA